MPKQRNRDVHGTGAFISNYPESAFPKWTSFGAQAGARLAALKGGVSNHSQIYDERSDSLTGSGQDHIAGSRRQPKKWLIVIVAGSPRATIAEGQSPPCRSKTG
jgi:hypothetical protein